MDLRYIVNRFPCAQYYYHSSLPISETIYYMVRTFKSNIDSKKGGHWNSSVVTSCHSVIMNIWIGSYKDGVLREFRCHHNLRNDDRDPSCHVTKALVENFEKMVLALKKKH